MYYIFRDMVEQLEFVGKISVKMDKKQVFLKNITFTFAQKCDNLLIEDIISERMTENNA